MTLYINPFYARASEHHRDVHQFVSSFGPGALDMLPSTLWDRLVILRSTPGAGKTSLMRLFTVESLQHVRRFMKSTDSLYRELATRDALDTSGLRKLGVLLTLDKDYRSLLDLPFEGDKARRLFLRLLDVRLMIGVMRSALILTGRRFPDDVDAFTLVPATVDAELEAAIERLGGPAGSGLFEYARSTERSIIRMLDAIVASEVDSREDGHNELYSLSVLSQASVCIDGAALDAQTLVMFDDGHELAASQRRALLDELRPRRLNVARWYAERFEALSDQELLGGVGRDTRDYVLADLDAIAREGAGPRFQRGRYDRVLMDIARRRAATALSTYSQESSEFLSLLDDDRGDALGPHESAVLETLEQRASLVAGGDRRYERWLKSAIQEVGFERAVRLRELEILIHRDQDRQRELFSEALGEEDVRVRSNPAVREAAALSVANEFHVPYYAGRETIVRLGSHNAEQFLNLCGDLFAEMLVEISLGRRPRLSFRRQHRVIYEASEKYWTDVARTVPRGRDVQALISEIVAIARFENAKPSAPYPPGVTGTALSMAERAQLLDVDYRNRTPGAERLFTTLAAAVAHNVLVVELDYAVKGSRYMVMYLNRLLCPRFGLPVGLGSFREKRLSVMLGWIRKLPASRAPLSAEAESLAL